MTMNPIQAHAIVAAHNAGWTPKQARELAQYVHVTVNPGHGRRVKFRAELNWDSPVVAYGSTPTEATTRVMQLAAEVGA